MPTVTGVVTQAGMNALAAAVVSSTGTPTFSGIRIKDSGGAIIASQSATFTATPAASGVGTVVEGTTVFSAANVTADVHSAEMINPAGTALVTAIFNPPLPFGSAVSVTMSNTFNAPV